MEESEAETPRIEYKVFTFRDNDENSEESLSVTIPEVCPGSVQGITSP